MGSVWRHILCVRRDAATGCGDAEWVFSVHVERPEAIIRGVQDDVIGEATPGWPTYDCLKEGVDTGGG